MNPSSKKITIKESEKQLVQTEKRQIDFWKIAGACVLVILLIYLIVTLTVKPIDEKKTEISRQTRNITIPMLSKIYNGNLPTQGNRNAPILLVEFADYQCPFCEKFYSEAEKVIQTQYIATGKVQFAYRDYPQNSLHDKASLASLAAQCANKQGKFWEMHDALYTNGKKWETVKTDTVSKTFSQYGEEIGLNRSQFTVCMNQTSTSDITNDIHEAQELGIRGTPTFLIYLPKSKITLENVKMLKTNVRGSLLQDENNYIILIEGAQRYTVFKTIFDSAG